MSDHPGASLRLETVTSPDRVVVIVRGDVDASTAPQLAAVAATAVVDSTIVEFDLGELGFFDSTGLSVVAQSLRALEAVDGTLVLSHVPDSVRRLLTITDLLRFVSIVD